MHKWVIDDNGNRFVHSTLDEGYSIKGNKIKGRFMGEYFEVDGLKFSTKRQDAGLIFFHILLIYFGLNMATLHLGNICTS